MADTFFVYLKKYKIGILPIELLNEETFKRAVLMGNIVKIVCSLNFLFATIAALGFITAPEYFNEKTYLSVWIQETFPDYSNLMLLVVHWTSLPVALVMVGSSIGWAYAGTTAIFQIHILREFIGAIAKTSFPRKMRRESKLYQESVKQRMIIAITAYEVAVGFLNLANDILEPPVIMFSIGSVILGGSLMIEFLSNQEQNFGDQYAIYVGIFFFALAGIISGNLYILIGQAMKDESEGCNYIMRQFPWYYLNKENKQIYSIFLRRTEKPLCISCSLVQIDYFLLMRYTSRRLCLIFMKMSEITADAEVLGIYGKLVGLKEMKRGSKDRLQLLIRLTFGAMNFPPIRIILIYVFCQYSFATILALFHLLRKFDTKTLLRHGSFCGFQIFVLINLWVILFLSEDFYKYLKKYEKECLPVEMLKENTLKRVEIMSNILKVICCLDMIFATMAAIGFITAPEYFNEKTYLAVWIQETFPEYSTFLLVVVQLTSLPVALVMAGTSISWAYAGANTLFQVYILKEMLQGISKSNISRKMRLDSQIYQTEVREKLIMSIMAFELEFE
ncbi:uncharacterized protein LOC123314135 [Coccinella septempunctata]|uniref:uncharacterized protein LOC123314135 n=1 Tax=Coccinella septempunctata TaxID=41139 RepID=UPI001D05D569|nr:uncharacterized protein LOC123314135 [Coccinella septempunctata]